MSADFFLLVPAIVFALTVWVAWRELRDNQRRTFGWAERAPDFARRLQAPDELEALYSEASGGFVRERDRRAS